MLRRYRAVIKRALNYCVGVSVQLPPEDPYRPTSSSSRHYRLHYWARASSERSFRSRNAMLGPAWHAGWGFHTLPRSVEHVGLITMLSFTVGERHLSMFSSDTRICWIKQKSLLAQVMAASVHVTVLCRVCNNILRLQKHAVCCSSRSRAQNNEIFKFIYLFIYVILNTYTLSFLKTTCITKGEN